MGVYHFFLFLSLNLLFKSVTPILTSTTTIQLASVKGSLAINGPFGKFDNVTTTSNSSAPSYWLEDIAHQGLAPFNFNDTSYQVFRNVKDFGAKG